MTDIRRGSDARVHQTQPFRDTSYRPSCNSTPEPRAYAPAALTNGHHHVGAPQRNPLLQTLADHAHMESTSGGSTTSSSATIAARPCNGSGNVNGNAAGEIQFDEREIYYVSPSKRKGSCGALGTTTAAPLRSSLRTGERQRCHSPTAAATAHSHAAVTPSAAYGARAAGEAHDFSFDNYETTSRYSDTAMQLLRSGSCSGNLAASAGNCSSSSSSLAQQHAAPAQRTQNNVTFSNCVAQQPPPPQPSQHRGSLRRNKGRSNQSLCSCDAGADTEINPDPARPLYQYSLERRSKAHTYTCEQNAQILLRLQRERSRKLSLGAGGPEELQSDTQSSSDVDAIPPVPPPPAMKRNGSMRSLRLLQQRPASNCSNGNNNNNSTIATLCNGDILNDCVNSALDIGAVLDDCTTSILKCANAVGAEILAATSNAQSKPSVATLATMASHAKPDVCRVGSHATTSFSNYPPPACISDDIYTPHSKKTDPALCFLHIGAATDATQGQAQQPNRSSLTLNKYNTIGSSGQLLSQYSLQQQLQQARISDSCRCFSQSFSNFSRDYFGQQLQQQQQQQKHQRSGSIGGCAHRDNHNNKLIFHTGEQRNWLSGAAMPPPPVISRSYGNLLELDGRQHGSGHSPYQKFHTPANAFSGSSCSFGAAAHLLNNASFTTLSSSNSGLKEKLHQHLHHHEHHLHGHESQARHHPHTHTHHGHPLQPQTAAQQQKHQQLHSSVTSIMPWKHRQCPSRGSSSSGTNSFRFDAAKHWLAVSSILLIIGAASVAVPLALRVAASAPFDERLRVAVQLLDQVPLIDGHNDLPWNIRKFLHNKLNDFNFDEDLRNVMPWARSNWSHTDLQRLKKGRISAQFWAAYVPCEAQYRDAVQLTLEQIDVIKRLTDRYSPQLTTCTSSDEIIEAHKNHQLCSLTGVEGGHSLGGSLAVLRTLYAIGVRYMTLTSTCHTPWADSSYADAPTFNVKHGGLTIFGKTIIREMNRLGMMVDLSHVSTGTMRDALEVSEAPVIFSHSSAYELCNSSRNVQDDMLQSLAKNGGLVMVNFYSKFLSCSENSTVHDAVAHINHIKRVAGIDHVGLGAGYDGINFTPKGLEDVSSYPTLFAELLGGDWSIEELTKLAGGNFLRVMKQVEKIRDEKKAAGVKPYEDNPSFRTDDPYNCTSS